MAMTILTDTKEERPVRRRPFRPVYYPSFGGDAVLDAPAPSGASAIATALRSERARRYLNVFVAIVGLIVLSPVFLLIALAIRLTSKGPVIYSQTRVGVDRRSPARAAQNGRRKTDLGGRPFTIYKFRTMCQEGSRHKQVWATRDDPRVTPIGRVMRKLRLDELPQLVNVLKGDMNIVGPRPEQPAIFANLREEVPGYHLRQRVLPGITGWAQVNQSYDTCLEDVRRKVKLDLEYILKTSAAEDLRIMAMTLPVLMRQKLGW